MRRYVTAEGLCAAGAATDDRPRKPFDVTEVDVVVADVEDICRAAAASALRRFGFLPARVHEVESGDEAFQSLTALQAEPQQGPFAPKRRAPIIVFLDHRMAGSNGLDSTIQLCGKSLPRELFLVCASNKHFLSTDEQRYFHCSVLKTFEATRIAHCLDQCQQWWVQGGGDPSRRRHSLQMARLPGSVMGASRMDTSAALAAATCPALPTFQAADDADSEEDSEEDVPATQASWSSSQHGKPSVGASTAASAPTGLESPTRRSAPGRGNCVESLGCLLPPKPPFEDVEMKCLVGRGSFGRVYRARWDVATVALKVVETYQEGTPAMIAFEGALSASLAHPNLVQTFKYSIRHTQREGDNGDGSEPPDPRLCGFEVWIVQEWCGLGTLSKKISRREMLETGGYAEVAEVSAEIASAASYLHSRGIIHGDLTSCNVLLVERSCPKGYTAKVTDFGLARVLDLGASAIKTATMGTVTYMPPELFQLEGNSLTKKVDVYAFGVILWQLCTSDTPFEGLQPTQVVVLVSQGASLQLPAGVPEPLGRIFAQSISRNPADRPGLERIVQDLMPMMNLGPASATSGRPSSRSR